VPKYSWIEKIETILRMGTEDERANLFEELAETGNDVATVILISAIPQEKSAYVRRKIMSLLGAKKDALTASLVMPLLSAGEAHVRGMAREILVSLGSVAIEGLTDLMLSDSRDVRKQAVDVLAEIPGECSLELLIEGLEDSDIVVVTGCIDALGQRGDKRSVAPLEAILKTFPPTWVGFSIIQALNALGDEKNIAVMNEYMTSVKTSGDRTVLAGAWAEAIGRACKVDALPMAWEFYQEGILPPGALLRILNRVQYAQPKIDLGHPALISLLTETLLDGSGQILMDAASLAAIYNPAEFGVRLPNFVEKIAKDERFAEDDVLGLLAKIVVSSGLRAQDMGSLLISGREASLVLALSVAEVSGGALPLAEISGVYQKTSPDNAARMLRLAARSGAQAMSLYYEVLESESNEEVMTGALEGAASLPEECAAPFFCRALLHSLSYVRKVAMGYLIRQAPPGVEEILAGQFADACVCNWPEILAVLSAFNPSDLEKYWRKVARIEDSEVRVRLAAAIGYIIDENLFMSVVKTLANDPEAAVRRMAILSLSRRSGEKVWGLLSYLYENDPEKKHRYDILACHEVWRHPKGFDWLKENLSEDAMLQTAAVRSLGGFGLKGMQALKEAVGNRPDDARLREMVENL
jgi:hypothetical protein